MIKRRKWHCPSLLWIGKEQCFDQFYYDQWDKVWTIIRLKSIPFLPRSQRGVLRWGWSEGIEVTHYVMRSSQISLEKKVFNFIVCFIFSAFFLKQLNDWYCLPYIISKSIFASSDSFCLNTSHIWMSDALSTLRFLTNRNWILMMWTCKESQTATIEICSVQSLMNRFL